MTGRRLIGALGAIAVAIPLSASPRAEDALREHLWTQTISLDPGQRPRVALALSGGGARGYAHLGFYEILERENFPIDAIAGTSIGAVLGAGLANGLSAEEVRINADKIKLDKLVSISKTAFLRLLFSNELGSSKKMDRIMESLFHEMRFADLKLPFACTAMDIKTGETIVFRNGTLAPAIRASMNLPGIFAPKAYRHRLLVDGGVTAFVPVQVARRLGGDWVLAHVTMGDFTNSDLNDVVRQFEQVIDIRGWVIARAAMKEADAVVEAPVKHLSSYDFTRTGEAYLGGLKGSHEAINRLKDQYTLFSLPRLSAHWRSK